MKADRVVILAGLVLLHRSALAFLLMQRIAMRQEPEVTVFEAAITSMRRTVEDPTRDQCEMLTRKGQLSELLLGRCSRT